ncbi:site-specific integrase [Parahaliea maris]|uniref:Site-specific integrase n=1 Tax=Parahaliea maris TaxID=2716870 RepID=A0A5C8ZN55_9GAMM|nr:site-specific integrase [Parahaliea maris]TXS89069.1 site-specific integrase [Parahaliea maris]
MATIRKRVRADGEISYQAIVRRQGYRDQRKTFDSENAAKDWAYDLERDIRDRRVDPRALGERRTVGHAIETYLEDPETQRKKSFKDIKRLCTWWKDRVGRVALGALTPTMIASQVDPLTCEGPTKNRYIGALGGCLTYISQTPHSWIQTNPCRLVKKYKKNPPRQRVLKPREWKKLLAYVDEQADKKEATYIEKQFPLFLRLAYDTGRRRGELLKLTWDCVDLDDNVLYLLDTKTGEDQEALIDDDMVERLEQHREAFCRPGCPYVFAGRKQDAPIGRFDELIRSAMRANFEPDMRDEMPVLHTLRHTAATEMGAAGATLHEIMEVTGHRSAATVLKYTKRSRESAKAAHAKRKGKT